MSGAKIGLNSVVLIGSEGIRRLIALVVVSLVARTLAVEDFGVFRVSNSFLIIFLTLSNFGLIPLVIKKVAEKTDDEARIIGNAQGIKIVLSLATIILTCVLAAVLGYGPRTRLAIFVAALAIPAESLRSTHLSWYDGRQKMSWNGAIEIGRSVFLLGAVVVVHRAGWGLFGILTAYLLHYVLGEIISEAVSAKRLLRTRPLFEFSYWLPMLRESAPFLIIGIVWIVTFRIDMILLSRLKNEYSVGIYGAAYSLFEVLILLPTMLTRALYPALAGAQKGGNDAEMFRKSMRIFFLVAFPAGVGLALVSGGALHLVFGDRYLSAAPVLSLMSAFLFVWFCTMGMSWAMTVRGRLKLVLTANIVALFANVAANFALIPKLDFVGAGIATVLSECVYLAVIIVPVHRELLKVDFRIVHIGTLISTALMAVFVWHFHEWPLAARIALGGVIYIVCAFATGALREPFIVSMVRNLRGGAAE